MNRSWFGVREPAVADGFGARLDGQMPMRVSGAVPRVAREPASARSWWRPVLRIVRNAIVAAVAMALVPMTIVSVRGDHLANVLYTSNVNVRARMLEVAEPARRFSIARDPSVTPIQAGMALNALQYRRSAVGEFQAIAPAVRYARPWRINAVAPDMFVTSRPDMYDGPSSRHILEAAANGFSPRERAYLKQMAEAPIWREFDLVARAPAVDMVGGQLRVPFEPDARPEQRPLPSYRDSKELASAAVSRAAYYMSVGKPREAEQVLRSIISFGLAFIDNGTTTMDELIGTVDVGIGRDALRRFYVLQHDPRANLPELAPLTKGTFLPSRAMTSGSASPDEVRRLLLARLADPTAPRPERFEAARDLPLLSCMSVRGLLFGQRDDVSEAIERARSTLARFPSERALIDLGARLPSAAVTSVATAPLQSLAVSPAVVAGAVLQNPRMGSCTLLLTWGQ